MILQLNDSFSVPSSRAIEGDPHDERALIPQALLFRRAQRPFSAELRRWLAAAAEATNEPFRPALRCGRLGPLWRHRDCCHSMPFQRELIDRLAELIALSWSADADAAKALRLLSSLGLSWDLIQLLCSEALDLDIHREDIASILFKGPLTQPRAVKTIGQFIASSRHHWLYSLIPAIRANPSLYAALVPSLCAILRQTDDERLRRRILAILREMGPQAEAALPELLEGLDYAPAARRPYIILCLGRVASRRPGPVLMKIKRLALGRPELYSAGLLALIALRDPQRFDILRENWNRLNPSLLYRVLSILESEDWNELEDLAWEHYENLDWRGRRECLRLCLQSPNRLSSIARFVQALFDPHGRVVREAVFALARLRQIDRAYATLNELRGPQARRLQRQIDNWDNFLIDRMTTRCQTAYDVSSYKDDDVYLEPPSAAHAE